MEVIQNFWNEYYPIVLAVGGGVITFVAAGLLIWSQVKPILEKLSMIWEKLKGADKDDITAGMKSLDFDTKITDLKAKLENPTTSDELKSEYMLQLETALAYKAKLDAGLAKTEEVTNKFL